MNLDELKDWYASVDLPPSLGKGVLSPGVTVIDLPRLVASHFRLLERQNPAKAGKPYLDRLLVIKGILVNDFGVSPRPNFQEQNT